MFKLVLLALTICLATSAHSATDADHYTMAEYRANLQACYNDGFITPAFFAASDRAVDVMLRIGNYNRFNLNNLTTQAWWTAESQATQESCRDVEVQSYQLQNTAQTAIANQNAANASLNQAIQNFANMPRPVFCNRIGATVMCN